MLDYIQEQQDAQRAVGAIPTTVQVPHPSWSAKNKGAVKLQNQVTALTQTVIAIGLNLNYRFLSDVWNFCHGYTHDAMDCHPEHPMFGTNGRVEFWPDMYEKWGQLLDTHGDMLADCCSAAIACIENVVDVYREDFLGELIVDAEDVFAAISGRTYQCEARPSPGRLYARQVVVSALFRCLNMKYHPVILLGNFDEKTCSYLMPSVKWLEPGYASIAGRTTVCKKDPSHISVWGLP